MADRESAKPQHSVSPKKERQWSLLIRDFAKGVKAINIALAYVLSQPFEAFALIGPRFISETAGSFESLKIQLTPSELKWLNLEQNVSPR